MKVDDSAEEKKISGYEYLDHTADVQLHSWAPTLKEAFEQVNVAMFGYICELEKVEIDEEITVEIEAEGHDMESLLYSLMDEFLFQFCVDFVVCKKVTIVEFDRENFKIKAKGFGETYNREKHGAGTEIKAITYSAMQIHENDKKSEVYVIVDI